MGNAAFAHKGGVHVSAIMKDSALYEHIDPSLVGNAQRVLMTEQGGKSNILSLSRTLGFELEKGDPLLDVLSAAVKKTPRWDMTMWPLRPARNCSSCGTCRTAP